MLPFKLNSEAKGNFPLKQHAQSVPTLRIRYSKKNEQQTRTQNWRRPYFVITESKDSFDIKVSIPGVSREGVDISITGENLNIVASRVPENREGLRVLRRKLPESDYRLDLQLNVSINEKNVQARVENGILNLTLPKSAESKTRKIEIS